MPIIDRFDDAPEDDKDEDQFVEREIVHSPFSLQSLRLETLDHRGELISTATGFIFRQYSPWMSEAVDQGAGCLSLITNYHVVSGTDRFGNFVNGCSSARRPFSLRVILPAPLEVEVGRGALRSFELPLLEEEPGDRRRLWFSRYKGSKTPGRVMGPEHSGPYPTTVLSDVAVLRISEKLATANRLTERAYVWDRRFLLDARHQKTLRPTDPVYVIGYPASVDEFSPTMPIWTTGSVANEVNAGPEERFFIDSRTRAGQSGSPVILYRRKTHFDGNGGLGGILPEDAKLLGVYSGRTDVESDIGSVWWGDEIERIHALAR